MGTVFGGELMSQKARRFTRETKLAAVKRMLAGDSVTALSRELNILRKDLYKWRASFLSGGPAALRDPGRPRAVGGADARVKNPTASHARVKRTHERIAELEKKVRRQEIELRSIREVLRQVELNRRPKGEEGSKKPRSPQH
jgi:transposase